MILFLLLLALTFSPKINAATSNIIGTVKINVCGDSLVESPAEECEGEELNGGSCAALGYSSGSLTCDIACTYNTSSCITPDPITSNSLINSTSQTDNVETTPHSPSPSIYASQPIATQLFASRPTNLSKLIEASGLGKTSTLRLDHLDKVIRTWVTEWEKTNSDNLNLSNLDVAFVETTNKTKTNSANRCDINNDATCNLTDLSVILFYFNR